MYRITEFPNRRLLDSSGSRRGRVWLCEELLLSDCRLTLRESAKRYARLQGVVVEHMLAVHCKLVTFVPVHVLKQLCDRQGRLGLLSRGSTLLIAAF